MAALTYDLKKHLALVRRSAKRQAIAMKKALRGLKHAFPELFWADIRAIQRLAPDDRKTIPFSPANQKSHKSTTTFKNLLFL